MKNQNQIKKIYEVIQKDNLEEVASLLTDANDIKLVIDAFDFMAENSTSYRKLDKLHYLLNEKGVEIEFYTKSYDHFPGSQLCDCGAVIGYNTWKTVEWVVAYKVDGEWQEEVIYQDDSDYERYKNLSEEDFMCHSCREKIEERNIENE